MAFDGITIANLVHEFKGKPLGADAYLKSPSPKRTNFS